MIKEIQFKNFKVLRDTTLPLGRFTLLVGPNGSGKSTALQALERAKSMAGSFDQVASFGATKPVVVSILWQDVFVDGRTELCWRKEQGCTRAFLNAAGEEMDGNSSIPLIQFFERCRIFNLDPHQIARTVQLQPKIELEANGSGLAGVLDRFRDGHPERFEDLNQELNRWLPEFDRVLFDVPTQGARTFLLRTTLGHSIRASDLSHGTLLALAILTIAYLPDPPSLVAFEDPDRGLHPRLLREVQDALYRLAYPENFGEQRQPVQVIATTHSPYFLDLFRAHPEEIVIAQKRQDGATFERLSDREDIEEILADASLGEVWYSGILGGVPVEQ
jgi:predicted ATPase